MSSSSYVHFKLVVIWKQRGDRATEVETLGRIGSGFGRLERCCTCALVGAELLLAVVAERRLGLGGVPGGVGLEWPGHPRDVGQLGGRASQRGRPTLQQELSVVDDPGACKVGGEREKKPTGKVQMKAVLKIKDSTSLTSKKKIKLAKFPPERKNGDKNAQRSHLLVTSDLCFFCHL